MFSAIHLHTCLLTVEKSQSIKSHWEQLDIPEYPPPSTILVEEKVSETWLKRKENCLKTIILMDYQKTVVYVL